MQYPIGTQFIKQGRKHAKVETVVDMLTTKNLAGEVVKVRYVSEHDLMGQPVKDYDVCAVTIARGLVQ